MLSLDNAFSATSSLAWGARIERVITDPVAFVGEPKLDGLAISLLYEDGRLRARRPHVATARPVKTSPPTSRRSRRSPSS